MYRFTDTVLELLYKDVYHLHMGKLVLDELLFYMTVKVSRHGVVVCRAVVSDECWDPKEAYDQTSIFFWKI